MKILVCLFVLCPLLTNAQHITTNAEYNYLTTQYKASSDLRNIKPGYRLEKIIWEEPIDNYTFEVSSLIKLDEKQVAAILVVAKTKSSEDVNYLCIPFGDQDLLELYAKQLSTWDASMLKAYTYFSTTYYAGILAKEKNSELISKPLK